MPTTTAHDRRIRLNGARNVRELGGLATEHGKALRRGILFRADNLHALSDDDMDLLTSAIGLRSVIDLRRNGELAFAPNRFRDHHTVAYLHRPLFDDPVAPGTVGQPAIEATPRTLNDVYKLLLDTRSEAMVGVLRDVLHDDHRPTVIHCTAGKDRTGIVIALILSAVGVTHDVIAADYALTSEAITEEYLAEARDRAERAGHQWSAYQPLLICPPELMLSTLAYLDETYDGARSYLLAHGMTEGELARLESILIAEDLA